MKYKALRKELDSMLAVLSGGWSVMEGGTSGPHRYYVAVVNDDTGALMVSGGGSDKSEALNALLRNWSKGVSEPYAPAAGSAEELKLKLAIMKG